ncbi:zonadhesin-like [Discoglossus pictus]
MLKFTISIIALALFFSCVDMQDVAEKSCPKGMDYIACGTACPLTCDNCHDPPKPCTKECNKNRKCFCKEGSVLLSKDSDVCVEKEKCPSKCCPKGMDYIACGTACPLTCDNCHDPPKPCTNDCNKNRKCFCKEGSVLLSKDSDVCVEKEKCPSKCCPKGMDYIACGTACPLTCDNCHDPPKPCTRECKKNRKCFCKEGSVLLSKDSDVCVEKEKCPSKLCPENMQHYECDPCVPSCNNSDRACNKMCQNPGCYCKPGLVTHDNKCVDKSQCPIKEGNDVCPENMQHYQCEPCVPSCENLDPVCTLMCRNPGCYCKPGLVTHDNKCVDKSQCPIKEGNDVCPENMEFKPCGTLCPKTCENKDRAINCMSGCSDQKCFCKEGYVLLKEDSDICVKKCECPVKECPENMEFTTCGTLCPKTCDNKDALIKCLFGCSDKKCICKKGYVLLNQNSSFCVKECECPVKDCPENMEFKPCGTLCPRTCDNKDYAIKCMSGCSKKKCFCKQGYVLLKEDSDKCVKEFECPVKEIKTE